MTELEALTARIAELEARLAAPAPPAPEPPLPVVLRAPFAYEPPPTKALALINADPALRHLSTRQLWQLAVAIALCEGATLVGSQVPNHYEATMKRLAEARSKGLGWRAALAEVGLTPPDNDDIAHRARALHEGLTGLWDAATDLLGRLEYRLPNWLMKDLTTKLRPLV